jgi:hypothetical protein
MSRRLKTNRNAPMSKAGQTRWKLPMRSPREQHEKYPIKAIAEANSITPQVQKNTSHSMPRLLPGPGIKAVAGKKKTHATTVAVFVMRRLGCRLGGGCVTMRVIKQSLCRATAPLSEACSRGRFHAPSPKGANDDSPGQVPSLRGAPPWVSHPPGPQP